MNIVVECPCCESTFTLTVETEPGGEPMDWFVQQVIKDRHQPQEREVC